MKTLGNWYRGTGREQEQETNSGKCINVSVRDAAWKTKMEIRHGTCWLHMTHMQNRDRTALERGGTARRKIQSPQLVLCFQTKEEELGPLETNQISLASRLRVITAKLSLSAAGTVC